jgi:GT2 family glycosyltransferase
MEQSVGQAGGSRQPQKLRPHVSVIVASHNARRNIEQCLSALEVARQEHDAEIIIVDNSSDGTAGYISTHFPQVTLLRAPPRDLTPLLWEAGIRAASGDLVAITTADFIPRPDWIGRIVEAHQEPYAGVGGAIENEPEGGPVSWAIYFCRYSPYMPPFDAAKVHDFAGDNASYKRSKLLQYEEARQNGFWEAEVHARMVADGLELYLCPRILVTHRKSYSFGAFMAQRFFHGRQCGSERAARMSLGRRITRVFAAPLVPFVMLYRVAMRVLKQRRRGAQFLAAAPVMLAFFSSWAAGELVGFIAPSRIDGKM